MSLKLLDFWAPWCIDPETPVLTENGYLKASQIKVGQKLATVDPITYKISYKKVRKTRIFQKTLTKRITLSNEQDLIGDRNHLVLTKKGFKPLWFLKQADQVLIYQDSLTLNEILNITSFRNINNISKEISNLQSSYTLHLIEQKNLFLPLSNMILQDKKMKWENVKTIEDVEDRYVIGITVEAPHTIITNGVVSHNCGPCKMMEPVFNELKKEYEGKVEFVEINVDEHPEEAAKYGVMGIPTYIVIKDDTQEVGRKIGFTPKAELVKLLQQ